MSSTKWSGGSDYFTTSYTTPSTNTALAGNASYKFNDNNVIAAMSAVAEFPNLMGEIVRI
jgi:hypothetical protein